MKHEWRVIGAVCVLVIGMYACMAQSGVLELLNPNAADTYYNLLVRGFRAGQLSLKKDVPPGFAQLTDPYDPVANAPFRGVSYGLQDLSYRKGKLYVYFGVTPALILFWPFVAVTGRYLHNAPAVTIFCAVGFLASVGVLCALWRRCFAEVSVWVVAACALALGLATAVPVLLPRSDVYEVAISCGYALTMLALGAIWCALQQPERRCPWLAAASVAYGLALGARPSLLFGAIILLVPVIQAWRERRPVWPPMIAAIVPIVLIGLGLMLYNAKRFDSLFEFGQRYQLARDRQETVRHFSPNYLWLNFRLTFLEPVRWGARFPFVHQIAMPHLPAGQRGVDKPFGILTNIPLVWLALIVPLAWRGQPAPARSSLRGFLVAAAMFWVTCALTIDLYFAVCMRHQVEFLPTLVLLAAVGILGLERVLANQPIWRRVARWSWGLVLGFSVAFNLLASVEYYVVGRCESANVLAQGGHVPEAIQVFENALRIEPDYAEGHNNLGIALWQAGKRQEAAREYEHALRFKPDYADAHVNLGAALIELGRTEDAIRHCEEALRVMPDCAEAHMNLGNARLIRGEARDAMAHYEEALRIKPGYVQAHDNLGIALAQTGNVPEAMKHWEQALRFQPDDFEAHYNLGFALEKMGRSTEAIEHYKEALAIRPDFATAARALRQLGVSQ